MERAASHLSHVFTTVSDITGNAVILLSSRVLLNMKSVLHFVT